MGDPHNSYAGSYTLHGTLRTGLTAPPPTESGIHRGYLVSVMGGVWESPQI